MLLKYLTAKYFEMETHEFAILRDTPPKKHGLREKNTNTLNYKPLIWVNCHMRVHACCKHQHIVDELWNMHEKWHPASLLTLVLECVYATCHVQKLAERDGL